jgi:signal transduction histidine kinase
MKKQTNIVTLQQELEQAQQVIAQFIYSCSHSLMSPLTTIEGLLMLAKNDDTSDVNEYLARIQHCVANMQTAIRSLQDYTSAVHSEHSVEEVQADELVEKVLREYDDVIEQHGIKVFTKIAQEHAWYADEQAEYIILKNLIGNAIQFRDTEKKENKIRVEVAVKKDAVKLEVSDNGIGIPASEQKKVFIPFHRGSIQSKGNGLGLFLVKGLADKLNASVSIRSNEMIGTSFSISLPNQAA